MATFWINGRTSISGAEGFTLSSTYFYSVSAVPNARLAYNNSRPVLITHLNPGVGGRNGSRSERVQLRSAGGSLQQQSNLFTIPSGSASMRGAKALLNGGYITTGGTSHGFGYTQTNGSAGGLYVGRGSVSGASIIRSDGTESPWPNNTLVIQVTYVQAPTAPQNLLAPVVSDVGATLSWDAPSDNGGSSVKQYAVQVSTDPAFGTINWSGNTTGLSVDILTGLTPGTTYYARVSANNGMMTSGGGAVTSPLSAWSNVVSFVTSQSGAWNSVSVRDGLVVIAGIGDGATRLMVSRDLASFTPLAPPVATDEYAVATHGDGVIVAFSADTATESAMHPYRAPVGYPSASGAVVAQSDGFHQFGEYSFRHTFAGVSGSTPVGLTEQALAEPLLSGIEYTASLYVQTSVNLTAPLVIYFYDPVTDAQVGSETGTPVAISSGWQRLDHTFTVPSGGPFRTRIGVLVAESPTIAEATMWVDGKMLTVGSTLFPYFDGSTPPDSQWFYQWDGVPNSSASSRVSLTTLEPELPFDPDCPPPPAPPRPPEVEAACQDVEDVWERYWYGIPAADVSLWASDLPTITITTAPGASLSQGRVQFIPNPDGLAPELVDPNTAMWTTVITYIPEDSVMVLDSVLQRATVNIAGTGDTSADQIIQGMDGAPVEWPELSCGMDWVLAFDVPPGYGEPDFTVEFTRSQ